jgi:hypothetical protein
MFYYISKFMKKLVTNIVNGYVSDALYLTQTRVPVCDRLKT